LDGATCLRECATGRSLASVGARQGHAHPGKDKDKLTGVLAVLKENGEAEFTLFTNLQIHAQGQWSAGADPSQGIDLKITGGLFKDAKGTGKLLLRADGKSISTLMGQGTNDSGEKFEVSFVAEE
jgi:hypothetical protein